MSNNSRYVKGVLGALALIAVLLSASVPAAHALVGPQTAGSNFSSSFNGDHTGWSKVSGPWKDSAKTYSTVGVPGTLSSIKHSGTYGNFIYTVRMKRTSSSILSQNVVYVRGNPSPLVTENLWGTGYAFGYASTGEVFVLKTVGGSIAGTLVALSPAVIPGANYNLLKVLAYGDFFVFYVNGTAVLGFEDPMPISNGYVGVAMFREISTTGDKLYVDYAKLSKLIGDPGPLPNVKWSTLGAPQLGNDLFQLP